MRGQCYTGWQLPLLQLQQHGLQYLGLAVQRGRKMKIAVVTSLAAKRYVKVYAGHVYAAKVQELGGRWGCCLVSNNWELCYQVKRCAFDKSLFGICDPGYIEDRLSKCGLR